MRRAIVIVLLGLSPACALDTVVDCRNLCERYRECFDSSADVTACTTRCQSRVDSGESDRADRCDSCLDGNSVCATAVAMCSADCGPLLAP